MPLWLFETLCAGVVVATLVVWARRRPARTLLADYATLAAAAWAGEASCIAFYRAYSYDGPWHLVLEDVPLLVPLIWPLVVLSASEVVDALWPDAGRWRALLVGAVVFFDASLVEVGAVHAGLWHWTMETYLGVPVVGLLGWGLFAAGATLGATRSRAALVVVALGVTHGGLILAWWGVFRWIPALSPAPWMLAVAATLGGLALVAAVLTRRRGRRLPPVVWAPRVLAALLFLALLATAQPVVPEPFIHAALVAAPYLAVTGWRGRGSPGAPPHATPRSR